MTCNLDAVAALSCGMSTTLRVVAMIVETSKPSGRCSPSSVLVASCSISDTCWRSWCYGNEEKLSPIRYHLPTCQLRDLLLSTSWLVMMVNVTPIGGAGCLSLKSVECARCTWTETCQPKSLAPQWWQIFCRLRADCTLGSEGSCYWETKGYGHKPLGKEHASNLLSKFPNLFLPRRIKGSEHHCRSNIWRTSDWSEEDEHTVVVKVCDVNPTSGFKLKGDQRPLFRVEKSTAIGRTWNLFKELLVFLNRSASSTKQRDGLWDTHHASTWRAKELQGPQQRHCKQTAAVARTN